MNTPDTEEWIGKIVEKVRYVEFLHGVPVELPSRTKELLRSGIREALTSRDTYWKKEIEKAVLKGERNRIIEQIREERDTYWKERVQQTIAEEIVELETWAKVTRNEQDVKEYNFAVFVLKKVRTALDTLLDNLK